MAKKPAGKPAEPAEQPDKVTADLTRPPTQAELSESEAKGKELIEILKRAKDRFVVKEMLSNPFDTRDVKFKPQMVKGNRCLAMAYIDARLVMDRLDETVGIDGWEDRYDFLSDGSVMCVLRVKIGDTWVTKSDVGSPSEQPDVHDRDKAAVSDALKRAAVKFGIGRYLYRLPASWVDYDEKTKRPAERPSFPAWAMPRKVTPEAAVPNTHEYHEPDEDGAREQEEGTGKPPAQVVKPTPAAAATSNGQKASEKPAKKPAAKLSADEEETLASIKRQVSDALTAMENVDDLNSFLPTLSSVPDFAKQPIWTYICETVGGSPVHWEWFPKERKFKVNAPAKANQTVPF